MIKTLKFVEIETVGGGDAVWAPGTNSWGEITDNGNFLAGACHGGDWTACLFWAIGYGTIDGIGF